MSANGPGLLVIERILRDRQGIWQQIVQERDLNPLTVNMLASSALALACYGAVLGAFHGVLMALTSAVKLPLLFLVTLAICLPTLYLFNLVFGARLSVRQALALVMVAITVTSMLAVAFAPISLFFLITAPDYGFFKLLNVAILTLSALVGLRFLTGGMEALNEHGLLSDRGRSTTGAQPAGAQLAVSGTAAGAAPGVVAPATPAATATPAAAAATGGIPGQPAEAPVGALASATAANGDAGLALIVGEPASTAQQPASTPQQPAPAAQQPAPGYVQPVIGQPALLPLPVGYPYPAPRPAPAPQQRPASMTLLYIWILLFGFVGTQLGWTLRPFFGSPGEKFALFRSIDGNFYAEIIRTISHLG